MLTRVSFLAFFSRPWRACHFSNSSNAPSQPLLVARAVAGLGLLAFVTAPRHCWGLSARLAWGAISATRRRARLQVNPLANAAPP